MDSGNNHKPSVTYMVITEHHSEQRIDNFLLTKFKGVPHSRIYRMIRSGEVRINKKRIKPSYKLVADDVLRLPPLSVGEKAKTVKPSQATSQLLLQRIVYEDDDIIVLNKPSGMAVHAGSSVRLGVIEALRLSLPGLPYLELVHRLDTETSGCLLLAKKRSTLRNLHAMLRDGAIYKAYTALTKGQWAKPNFTVQAALEKYYLPNRQHLVKVTPHGKAASTTFMVRQKFAAANLVIAQLHTGRTHQIRVHAQYMQHPIAGDDRYGDADFNQAMQAYQLNRLFLHAHALELEYKQQHLKIIAPLDQDLLRVVAQLPAQ